MNTTHIVFEWRENFVQVHHNNCVIISLSRVGMSDAKCLQLISAAVSSYLLTTAILPKY